MGKRIQERKARQLGRQIELRDNPTLPELLVEVEQLIEQFLTILRRHPVEPATEENLPVRLPLNLLWRPGVSEAEPSCVAAEVISWTDLLRVHLINVQRYFVDWEERPETLAQFPLSDYPSSFRSYQGVNHDDLVAKLREHMRLLLVEAEKQRLLLRQTLPRLLREARKKLGISQAKAAGELQVSVETWKSWEQGRAFPRGIKHTQIRGFLDRIPAERPQSTRAAEEGS